MFVDGGWLGAQEDHDPRPHSARKEQAEAEALARLKDLELIHVPGHAGVLLNERADALAVQAVKNEASTGWVVYESKKN